ncbi:MAG TPA: carbamoyltransferase HypF [Saprospiraceae bacterium]|nr:carbamoyltransferase HypF [Saprospiraceae bacterium]HMQ82550.1 carbamoyltransferase HypF [Saprospiraceae bacterium]
MITWHIHIRGQVQGIGFRPFVFRMANEYELFGWVNNGADGVHVNFNATPEKAGLFYKDLIAKAPHLARITGHSIERVVETFFDQFQIIESSPGGNRDLLLSPDFSVCDNCREDIFEAGNRREAYAFTTCTHCGPRYSIINGQPYDRHATSMDQFKMCEICCTEYENPLDRRYFSQTNSCATCGIQMVLIHDSKEVITGKPQAIFKEVVKAWENGAIIAIKGIGGYLLTCDATNEATINRLRIRKHRPTKPLALMYPNMYYLHLDFSVPESAFNAISSFIAPIVLLDKPRDNRYKLAMDAIAPGLDQVGIMLPYTPLYALLLQQFGRPIVATSGNLSNSPIVFRDEQAAEELLNIADLLLLNDREIVVPQDDSVLRWSPRFQQKIAIRRSRGLAPTYINPKLKLGQGAVLALGAQLKSTFAIQHQRNLYISQYLGDLEQYDTQQSFEHTIRHFEKLLQFEPQLVLSDKHPEYASSHLAHQKASELGCQQLAIQHHEAHFAAILGEHGLMDNKDPILGIIWDGTGLGDDGQIWGGELFFYENYRFTRAAHISYFGAILGDKMPKEPRISALSATFGMPEAEEWVKPKFAPAEWKLYQAMLAQNKPLGTSSMGRLFDAVAALLGVMDKQSYEGEAAMLLETCASRYMRENPDEEIRSYNEVSFLEDKTIPIQPLLAALLADFKKGEAPGKIAARFHRTLVYIIQTVARQLKIKQIAFSGGVFQNALLVDLIIQHLAADFDLYFHDQLSPNDENISFGQLMWYHIYCCANTASPSK